MDDSTTGGRRRSKGSEAASRATALQRLKAIREGRRSGIGFQVKVEEPIYDTVGEDDYAALVAERRDAARDFIVDDAGGDGLGYLDEGEEEDWARAHLDSSSGSDSESERPRKKKNKAAAAAGARTERERPKRPSAAAASLSAAAATSQRLSKMFTSAVFTKRGEDRVKGSVVESIVDDVIAEFAPDEADRERRRRALPAPVCRSAVPPSMPPIVFPVKSELPNCVRDSAIVESDAEFASAKIDPCQNGGADGGRDGTHTMELKGREVSDSIVASSNGLCNGEAADNEKVKVEVKVEKGERSFSLNAKVGGEEKSVPSASDGLKEVWREERESANGGGSDGIAVDANGCLDDKSDYVLDSDGSLPFYLIDAHEEVASSGTLYLFGKVKVGSTYASCCVVVKNMERCIYAIPNEQVFQNNAVAELERNVTESQLSEANFRTKLQDMAAELKREFAEMLLELNVSTFSMAPVKRRYAFERSDIPTGEQYVLKVTYPFKDPLLAPNLKGEHFSALLGTHTSALELFLVKRKIKGPSWLSLSSIVSCPPTQRVSWCKFEVTVNSPKDVKILSSSKTLLEIPPVVVTAINIKTLINEKLNINEIVSASVICCHKAKIDSPMLPSEWKKPGVLSHFTAVRKLDGGIFPMGFAKEVSDRNSKAGSNILGIESSERALLNRLMIELHKLDSDVIVGHNISGFDLDILLHRCQTCKVPSFMWSKVGRLKRTTMPKLTKGSSVFGSGASLGIMSCIAGRLLCDTFLCARDLLKEASYSLTELARTQLQKERKEITPHDIPNMFNASETLLQLVEYGETDAWLSLELMFHLSVLPLTRQLTNISGNLWGKTLQGARAQRVEYLLLHEFHSKKFMLPDKISARPQESSLPKRKVANSAVGEDDDLNVDTGIENAEGHFDKVKGKKGPAYAGGLVLEPKKGLYDKFILLLDFNSLYPSIIQEYNICFTTVEKTRDGSIPSLPTSKTAGVLPKLLKILVERRKKVKEWLKSASGLKVQQLDIQQQALKLTANSIYGCLGFSNSRFYAKPLAELITLQGREILQNTVDLVQNNLNLEVVYGDTDSIMIYTGLDDIAMARAIAGKVIQEVNKKYRCLEIDLDGLYKRMLLLKKKKYAAVKVHFKDGAPLEIIERKGLDMVRRDWSMLSKELGDFCLRQILSGGSCEEVVETIHNSLMKVQEEMRNGEVELDKYIIRKSLTKPPEDYPDAKSQPHVQVALRLKQNGYSTGCSAGDAVPYIICCQQSDSNGSSRGIAQRARHPDELKKDHGDWLIDIDYYLSQQIHPVVSRLCASIQGTSPARLAECLGLDSSRFQHKTTEANGGDPPTYLGVANDEERFRGCEPLSLACPSCSSSFECSSIASFICTSRPEELTSSHGEEEPSVSFWRSFQCPKCPVGVDGARLSPVSIANQVKRQVDKFISLYYMGLMMCDDEMCKYATRTLNLRVLGDSERGAFCPNYPRCHGHLVRQYPEADLYRQLSYFCYVLDCSRFMEKMESSARAPLEKEVLRIRPMVDLALSAVQKLRDRCAFGWVQLKDLTVDV